MEPQTAGGLWKLTRGDILYLRHIVEQAVADGHLARQNGYWQWVGEPVVPHGLVELVETHMGALPDADAGAVVDALAIGEPIELGTLRRIVDPDAVEEADLRGLIRLDDLDERIEVRLAHPLYGEVRRRRAAATRLRRLRGLLAVELADVDDGGWCGCWLGVGAEPRIGPGTGRRVLIRAAQGAIALADLALADRLAGAAVRAGGGPEARFLRAHALSWLGGGRGGGAAWPRWRSPS